MKTTQKGFSVVEILIIIVIIGLIGAVGWLVYDRQKGKTNNNEVDTQTSQQQEKQETPKEAVVQHESIPEGWKKYDSNPHFSFIYPEEWEAVVKVNEYPVNEVFQIRYVGEIKLNEKLDGWIYATADNGATIGATADVTQEATNSSLKIWRFGFGDAGYGSFTPTFVVNDKIYQITTGNSCPEKTADCMAGEEHKQAYDDLVDSIKLQ